MTSFCIGSNYIDFNQLKENSTKNTSQTKKPTTNEFYWMSDEEAYVPFVPTQSKYDSYWKVAEESFDGNAPEKSAKDLFVIRKIEYNNAFDISLYWAHDSRKLISPYDLVSGSFHLNLYKNGLKSATEDIDFSFPYYSQNGFYKTTFTVWNKYDQFDLSYDFSSSSPHWERIITGNSIKDYRLDFKKYFAFTFSNLKFLEYTESKNEIKFSIAIEFDNNRKFKKDSNELGFKVDGLYFKAKSKRGFSSSRKNPAAIEYRVSIPKLLLFNASKILLLVNKLNPKDITELVLTFIENHKPRPVPPPIDWPTVDPLRPVPPPIDWPTFRPVLPPIDWPTVDPMRPVPPPIDWPTVDPMRPVPPPIDWPTFRPVLPPIDWPTVDPMRPVPPPIDWPTVDPLRPVPPPIDWPTVNPIRPVPPPIDWPTFRPVLPPIDWPTVDPMRPVPPPIDWPTVNPIRPVPPPIDWPTFRPVLPPIDWPTFRPVPPPIDWPIVNPITTTPNKSMVVSDGDMILILSILTLFIFLLLAIIIFFFVSKKYKNL